MKEEKGAVSKKPGSTKNLKTGSWRTFRPIVDREKCTGCGMCEKFCPDNAIKVVDGKAVIDYKHCKGCLICMKECPANAIKKDREK